jgi:hydroxyethylthiazole kinase-like sugar kinase family protein
LNLNIGTLNTRTVPSMFLAGQRANALGHPVTLDPVGAGASRCARKPHGNCCRKSALQPFEAIFQK